MRYARFLIKDSLKVAEPDTLWCWTWDKVQWVGDEDRTKVEEVEDVGCEEG